MKNIKHTEVLEINMMMTLLGTNDKTSFLNKYNIIPADGLVIMVHRSSTRLV